MECILSRTGIHQIIVQDNFILHGTKEENKASYISGWVGGKGTQYLLKYEC